MLMMTVTVRFRGPIAARMKSPHFEVEIKEGLPLRTVIQLVLDSEKDVQDVWSDVLTMDRDALILLNEVDIGLTGGLDTQVQEDDAIVILPLVHGG